MQKNRDRWRCWFLGLLFGVGGLCPPLNGVSMDRVKAFGVEWRVEPSVMPNHIKMYPQSNDFDTPINMGSRFISEGVEYRIDAVCCEKVLIARPLENPSKTNK